MIKKAAESGANAIKFQTIIPDELFSEHESPDLYKMSHDWILSKNEHKVIKKSMENIELRKNLFSSTHKIIDGYGVMRISTNISKFLQ